MKSILSEITKLRAGRPMIIDRKNSNRYRIIFSEENGTKTAYCFSVPIYDQKTRKLIDLRFHDNKGVWFFKGSNVQITISEAFLFKNHESSFQIAFSAGITSKTERVIFCDRLEVYPTLNGIMVKAPCSASMKEKITLSAERPFMEIRSNDKYFSLMSEEFKPFMTVSCIGTLDSKDNLIAPCEIGYQKNNDREFILTVCHDNPYGKYVLYEINLHEMKMFQDTTVESRNPGVNNAFGGAAYIGNTNAYGEQWLYSRPNFSVISEMSDKQIQKAILHLPIYGGSDTLLSAFHIESRFCSFGSNWNNKIPAARKLTDSFIENGYHHLDITNLVADTHNHFLTRSEGLILKTKVKENGFTAVSTGDSYYAPQILELSFR